MFLRTVFLLDPLTSHYKLIFYPFKFGALETVFSHVTNYLIVLSALFLLFCDLSRA